MHTYRILDPYLPLVIVIFGGLMTMSKNVYIVYNGLAEHTTDPKYY